MKKVSAKDRDIYVQPLKFKHIKKLSNILAYLIEDLSNGKVDIEKYLDHATLLISSLTDLQPQEIDNLDASDSLKLLSACIDTIIEDRDFLDQIGQLTRKINTVLASTTLQKS